MYYYKIGKYVYETYFWLFVGTIVTNEYKNINGKLIPFYKLSSDAMKKIRRGWMRKTTIPVKGQYNKKYDLQCATWEKEANDISAY